MEEIIAILTSPGLWAAVYGAFKLFVALVAATNAFVLGLRGVAKLTPWHWDDKVVDAIYGVTSGFGRLVYKLSAGLGKLLTLTAKK